MNQAFGCNASDVDLVNATPIGSGAVSMVYRTTLTAPPHPVVAVKVLSKVQLLQQGKAQGVMNEKQAYASLGPHPFIERLHATAQSEDELYFVMENLEHGDLLEHIRTVATRRVKARNPPLTGGSVSSESRDVVPSDMSSGEWRCLDYHDIQLITAQLILALARVFQKGYAIRDLKAENVAFDSMYRACLIDFDTVDLHGPSPESNGGVAVRPSVEARGADLEKRRPTVSQIQAMRRMTAQFCGTAQYVSPEMIGECKWSYSSDLWALGVMVYHMLYGIEPFRGDNAFFVMKEIVSGMSDGEAYFPPLGASSTAAGPVHTQFLRVKRFILDLLVIDPVRRLGVHPETRQFDLDALRRHELFTDFDWAPLEAQLLHFRFSSYFDPTRGNPAQTAGQADSAVPSLGPLYHDRPSHSDSYSEYVYSATSEANPFERWMKALYEESAEAKRVASAQSSAAGGVSTGEPTTTALKTWRTPITAGDTTAATDGGDDDEIDDVIDDVGIRQFRSVQGVFE